MNLLAELRRRNVIRMAGLYLVGAWLITQVSSTVLPTFDVPGWVLRALIIVLALGFVPALIFAWVFELTPQGLKRDAEVKPEESIAPQTARRLNRAIIAVLICALVYFAADKFVLAPQRVVAPASTATSQITSGTAAAARSDVDPKSIAVLPFANLSDDKANAYFADGIQDEILTKLSKIGALRVISRTSTQRYASAPENLAEIARQLGVENILEGSVQKAGNAVHINVQLIGAAKDEHLWAESYNRALDDIFGVEGEVAQAVADALNAKLMPEENARTARAPTRNPEAHELYLQARAHFNRANDQYNYAATEEPEAIALYARAIAKDPEFALAYAELGWAQMYMYWFGPDRTDARLAAAKAAADRALELQPDLGEAHYALALYEYWGHRDYAAALQQIELARKTWPNSAEIEEIAAAIVRRQGDFNGALAGFKRAAEFDPRNSGAFFDVALSYSHLRRYAEADGAFAHVAELTQEPAITRMFRAENIVFWRGDLGPMQAAIADLTSKTEFKASDRLVFEAAWWRRDFAAAAVIAEADSDQQWFDPSNIALKPLLLAAAAEERAGDKSKALAAYERMRLVLEEELRRRPDEADLHLALGFANAGLGRKDDAAREAHKAIALMPENRDAVSGPAVQGYAARIFARIGENQNAIDLIAHLMTIPCGRTMSVALLKLDPDWDPLREDSRFVAVLTSHEGLAHE